MSDENKTFAVVLSILALALLFFYLHKTPPKLDDIKDPFIVKKVQTYGNDRAKYYGRTHKGSLFNPKPVILDRGRYTVGDIIYFPAQIKEEK